MPQLEQLSTYPGQIFWLLVSFSVLYWVMVRFAIPRLSLLLELRANKISSDLRQAENSNQKADEIMAGYEYSMTVTNFQVDNIMHDARTRKKKHTEDILQQLDNNIEIELKKNMQRIEAGKKEAVEELETVVYSLSEQIIHHIIDEKPDAAKLKNWVSKVVNRG